MDGTEHALLAGAMAIAVGFVEIAKKLADWLLRMRRGKSDSSLTVKLDPEVSHIIRDSHELISDSYKVVGRVDNDGIPLVYTPRSLVENQLKMVEAMRDLQRDHEISAEKHESELEQTNRRIDEILESLKKTPR